MPRLHSTIFNSKNLIYAFQEKSKARASRRKSCAQEIKISEATRPKEESGQKIRSPQIGGTQIRSPQSRETCCEESGKANSVQKNQAAGGDSAKISA